MGFCRTRKARVALAVTAAVLILVGGVCGFYLGDYYRADTEAVAAFAADRPVTRRVADDGTVVIAPPNPEAGLIFYPGGKVEHTAYEPLLTACAEQGILCVLTEMPFRLAVLDINAADGIREQYPAITRWYIGGHSLGGSMAAAYVEKHLDAFEGLVLLGSYSTADLSQSGLKVLSIYGSEDTVLNREKYAECLPYLPADRTEHVIAGGCHAYFGMYGPQDGDGTPTIDNIAQLEQTAAHVGAFIRS